MPVGFSKACRTCLTLDGTLISIYDAISYDGKGRVIDMIKDITKITPMKSDGLPELVCQTCFNEINRCYTFKVKCLNSDSTLRKLFETEEELVGKPQQVLVEEEEKECKPIIQNLMTLNGSDQVEPEQEPPSIKIKTEKDCDAFGYFVITSVCGAEDGQTFENFQAPQRYIKEEIDYDIDFYNASSTRCLTQSDVCPSNQSICFDNFSQETNCLQVKLEPEEPLESEPHNINTPLKPNIQCPKCGREFLYTSRLKKHMRSHDTRPYICSICCRTFKLSGQLRRHIDINHKHIKPFKCEECPRTFSFPSKLKEHLRSHNKGNKYPKNINSLSRTSVDKKEKEDQPSPIVKQRKSIDYAGQIQYEQKQEPKYDANTKDISSNLEDTFENKSAIWVNDHQRLTRRSARNMREEMKSPDFATNQVQANSTTTESACIKVKTRQSEKSTHIDYSFDSQDPEENNSPEGARKYNCPHCTKVFKYVSRLNEHVVCHSDARPFDCTNCGKFFKTPGQLTRHLKTSHKISSFSRRKAFSRRRGFKRRNINKGLVRKNVDPSSNQIDELNITENENKDEQTNETCNNPQNERSIENENTNDQTNETSNDFPENGAKQPLVNTNEINQGGSPSTIMSDQIDKGEVNDQSNKVVSECSNQLVESAVLETTNETEKQTTDEPPRIYHCDQCDKTFHSVSRYYEHMQGHGIDRPFICSLCGKGFKTYSNLNSHIIISHKKLKPFKCNDCQRAFSCKSNLKKHLSTRIWTNSCIEGFTGRQSTKKKVKDKTNLPHFNVELENKDSIINDHKDKRNRDGHGQVEEIIENPENVQTKAYETDAVGLQQESNIPAESESVEVRPDLPDPQELPHPLFDSILNQPENTVVEQTSTNPLECPVCKKTFVYLSYLKKHLQSHSTERPFGCLICDKNFKYKVSLKHHNAITHAKYKPYKCDKCPQDFVNEYNYRVHRNSHNKKTKKTKTKRRLAITTSDDAELLKNTGVDKSANNMHDRSVVEIKNEHTTCSVCSSSILSVKLTEHMQQYHNTSESTSAVTDSTNQSNQGDTLNTDPNNPLKCPQCGKVFLFASYLKKHMRCHNDERPHVCSNCGKAFKDHWRLRSHIREKHTLISKKYSHKKKKKNHNREKPLSTVINHGNEQNLNAKVEEPSKILDNSQKDFSEKDNLHETKYAESILERSDPSKSQTETMSKQEEKPSISTAKPQCSLCNRVFLFQSQLETHMRTHTGERPFSCPSCEKTFTQRGHLKNHILINHKKIMPFQCSFCLRGFASGFNMRVHMKTHTKEKRKKAKANQKSNSISGQADKHGTVGTTPKIANPQDKIQEQVIQDFENLELHPLFGTMSNQDETTNNEPNNYFECTNCDKTFLFRSQFNEHMQTHNTNTRPITCSICYKTFKMEAHLKNHTQMKHTKTKDYKCNECDRVFLTFYILNKHMRSHKGMCKAKSKLGLKKRLSNLKQNQHLKQLYDTSVNKDEIEDGNTKTISPWLEQVQKEIPAGRNNAQITCALCSVSVFSEDLTDHMKLCLSSSQLKSEPLEDPQLLGHPLFETLSNQDEQQTGDSKQCLQCKKDFCSVSRLAEHMRTHTDERPFICTACGRGFKQSGHLKSHFMIVHQKILPYKCNECPRVFSSRYNLKVHENTHTTLGSRKKGSSKRRVVVKKSYYKDPPYHAKPIHAGNANQTTVREKNRNENETGNENKNESENANESDKIIDMFQNPKEPNLESQSVFGRNEEKIRCSLCFVSVHPNNLTKHMQELHNLPEATLVKVKMEPSDKTESPEESEQLMHLSFESVLNQTESAQSDSNRRLQCPTCDKEFVHLSRLNEHMRSHSDERPFICLVCGKTFKRHGHLMTHIATCHKKSKPFKCKECPRTFSSSLNLNVHLQTHINEELPTDLSVETSLQNEDNVEPLPNDEPQCSIDDEITGESTADVTHQCTLCPTGFQ